MNLMKKSGFLVLADGLAEDTGLIVVPGSVSLPDEPASIYFDRLRYNTQEILTVLSKNYFSCPSRISQDKR